MKLPRIFGLISCLAVSLLLQAEPIPASHQVGGFAIGVQAYSFNRFTVFEAIEKTEQTGAKVIEFYPGQPLSPDRRQVKWDHNAGDDLIAEVLAKLQKHGVRAVNYGVVTIPKDEAAARRIFDFARKLGMYGVTTESVDTLDLAEKLAKEYDLRVCIHEHARRPNDPSYRVWDPAYIAGLVQQRDARIGACADIGHWQTSGIKPVDGLRTLRGRVLSLHMKDRAALGPGQHDCIFGTGNGDIGGVLAELRAQGFQGNIAVEYEFNWDNSVPDIAQCVGFVRGWSASR